MSLDKHALKIVYLSLARCTYSGPMEWERIPLVEVVDWERALNACLKAETRGCKVFCVQAIIALP